MPQQNPKRKHTAVRFAPGALETVQRLADRETEGNVSMMLRKLLKEALDRRGLK